MKLKYNDSLHGYWLDGKRCRGISSLAKVGDDTFYLERWRQRKLLEGLMLEPESVTHTVRSDGRELTPDEIIEEAMVRAGAYEAAEAGTDVHSVLELYDTLGMVIDGHGPLIDNYVDVLETAGLEVVPKYVERMVVYPDQKICGKFDRLFWYPTLGLYVVGDVKTGSSAIDYPQATAVQLAMYANAPLMADEFDLDEDGKGWTEDFERMPPVSKLVGIVVYIPMPGMASIYKVNIARGWQAYQEVIAPTLKWRSTPQGELIKVV